MGNGDDIQNLDIDRLRLDRTNLYREEVFTDLRVGSVRRLSPVTADGAPDLGRPTLFTGETQILTPAGPLPVTCKIEASSLEEALERFPEAVKAAVNEMVAAAEEMRRQEASRLVIPGRDQVGRLKL